MAPKSDANTGDDGKNKMSFKERTMLRIKDGIVSARRFTYNKDNRTIFGNTSSSWIKISVYYFFFYICLGLFFSGMIAVFGAIVSRQSPRYNYKNSQMSVKGSFYIGLFQF
jgi:predicted transglutaminase-like protease